MTWVTGWQQPQHKQENLEIDEKSCLSFLRPNYSQFNVQVMGGNDVSEIYKEAGLGSRWSVPQREDRSVQGAEPAIQRLKWVTLK
jgi:hypothetical protein